MRNSKTHKFHELFLEKVKPAIEQSASFSDKDFITLAFVNRSPLRLTHIGKTWLKDSKILEKPLEVKIRNNREPSPRELNFILKKTDFPFYLSSNLFVVWDPKIISHLILLDQNFDLFLGRKKS